MQKNYLLGGILLCIVPVLILYFAHRYGNLTAIPPEFLIMLAVCAFWGMWTVILSVFKLNTKDTTSYLAGSVMIAGVAAMFFVVAWRERDGWSGPVFITHAWSQVIPRFLFAIGGVLATLGSISLFRKAVISRRRG